MKRSRIIASVELGSSYITSLVAQISSDEMTHGSSVNIVGVSTVESMGIKKGQIVDIEEAVEAAITCVEGAERMAGYNLDSAYVALNGAHISSQNSHGVVAVSDPDGEISPDDVHRVIEAASAVSLPSSRELVHVIPREYIVDGESGVKDPVGMSGVRLEVDTHLITASSAAVKNLKKAVNEVGITIDSVIFSGLAAADAVLTKTEKELGCALVDIGGGTTNVVAFVDGSICHSAVIPIGAKNITNDLAIGLRVSLESAEKIKVALGEEKNPSTDKMSMNEIGVKEVKEVSRKTLREGIIRPRLNEIFTMVKLELEKARVINKIPSGAVICGGGALSVGIMNSAKRVLTLPVRVGKPRGIGGLVDDIINPQFAASVGLLLHGASQEPEAAFGSFAKRLKLPTKGIAGKIFDTVRDLLP